MKKGKGSMFYLRKKREGQSTVEYVFLITVVVGALIASILYIKRGFQGRWKQAVDQMGDQYDPAYAVTDIVHVLDSNVTTNIWTNREGPSGFSTYRTDQVDSVETRTGSSTIGSPP